MTRTTASLTPDQRIQWRAVWRLIEPFWRSEQRWRARLLLVAVIALTLGLVYIDVLFNDWNRDFYNALDTRDSAEFRAQLWRFSYLAFLYIAGVIYKIYLTQALEIRWRGWMTEQYMKRWLAHRNYYRIEQSQSTDNPDQRIAEDLRLLTTGTLNLGLGLLSSVVTLVSFAGILWILSGPFSVMIGGEEWNVHGYMLWFAVAYAVAGSGLVWLVGRRLVPQNANQQRFEADFRFGLVRIRENAESIALYRGEVQEQAQSTDRFERIRENWWRIMGTTKRLNLASTFYMQFAVIFPFLVGAPRYFDGVIKLGGLMQIASAFGQVQTALSWFVNAFEQLAAWKASINRLAGFQAAIEAAEAQPDQIAVLRNNVGAIILDELAVHLPTGQALNQPLTAGIYPGQKIVVTGPSGCGKSTLFRAMAGIWPYGAGRIEIPQSASVMFVPQRSYLPIGTLRSAIAYPGAPTAYKELAIKHWLEICRLAHLCGRLDDVANWTAKLSPGEQQRLAFVRVLLARPGIVFLDEATSALDADAEAALYSVLLHELPQATLLSIAHREQIAQYHHQRWQFVPRGVSREHGFIVEQSMLDNALTAALNQRHQSPKRRGNDEKRRANEDT